MTIGANAGTVLAGYLERIERLETEKAELQADIREVYAEAKASGFDPKIVRECVRLRRLDSAERHEQRQLLTLYLTALGME